MVQGRDTDQQIRLAARPQDQKHLIVFVQEVDRIMSPGIPGLRRPGDHPVAVIIRLADRPLLAAAVFAVDVRRPDHGHTGLGVVKRLAGIELRGSATKWAVL